MSENENATNKYDNKVLMESGEKMYLESDIADVYFVCAANDGTFKRIPAHKSVLAAASDVFKTMFYGELKEEGDVTVCDVTAAAFEEFLQFFYLREVKLTMDHIVEVFHLGHKYNIVKCFDVCVIFLKDHLSIDNVCIGLGFAILYEDIKHNDLKQICEKRIIVDSTAVFKSPNFLNSDRTVLAHILNMNLLSCSEVEVFEACMSWVKAKSCQDVLTKKIVDTYLGDLFRQIRFGSMTIEQFAALVHSYGLLFSTEEYKDIIEMIVLPGSEPKIFNGNPRQIQWRSDDAIKCDRSVLNSPNNSFLLKNGEITTFSTNESILLGGFICAKVFHLWKNQLINLKFGVSTEITIIEASSSGHNHPDLVSKDLFIMKTTLQSNSETVISLPRPLLIRPGFQYEIRLAQSAENIAFCCRKLTTEVQVESDITLQFWNDVTTKIGKIIRAPITKFEFNRI